MVARIVPLSLLLVLLAARPAPATTILNTLQGFDEGGPGWSGGLDGLFTGSGGNTDSVRLAAGGRVQWRGTIDRVRLQASGGYQESDRQVKARNLVVHLRHNRELGPRWATILFAQAQTNPFQRLRSRRLLGAGLRRDLLDDDRGTLALGATPMLEVERLEGEDGHLARGRLSVFLHASRQLGEAARLDAVVFWQPLFSGFGTSRTVANVALLVDVTGSVDLKAGAAVEDNAHAPAGVERTDWSTYAGFGVGF